MSPIGNAPCVSPSHLQDDIVDWLGEADLGEAVVGGPPEKLYVILCYIIICYVMLYYMTLLYDIILLYVV